MNVSSAAIAGATGSTSSSLPASQTIDSSGFLKLLTAQMQNQDPMEPMTGEQMLTQISQLTSVSELMKLNENFRAAQTSETVTSVAALLGRTVQYTASSGEVKSGAVTKVMKGSEGWQVMVGDTSVSLTSITSVE